jgi:death-on-curing protein
MTLYLSPQQVLFIHYRLIHDTGGQPGVRDLEALKAVLASPQQIENGQEAYPGLYKKAAVLLEALLQYKPFVDGNRRTAMAAVDMFLRLNGQRLGADGPEMIRFITRCAQTPVSLEYGVAWLWQYARPLRRPSAGG